MRVGKRSEALRRLAKSPVELSVCKSLRRLTENSSVKAAKLPAKATIRRTRVGTCSNSSCTVAKSLDAKTTCCPIGDDPGVGNIKRHWLGNGHRAVVREGIRHGTTLNGYWNANRNSLRDWESHGYALRNVDGYRNLLVLRHLHWSGYRDNNTLRDIHVHRVGLWYLDRHLYWNLHGHWPRDRPLNTDRHWDGDIDRHRDRDVSNHLNRNWYINGNWQLDLVRTRDRNVNGHRDRIIHQDVVRLVNSDGYFNTSGNLNRHGDFSAYGVGNITYHLFNDVNVPRHLDLNRNLHGNLNWALHGNGIWHRHRHVNWDRYRNVNRDGHRDIDRYLYLNGIGAVHLHINRHRHRNIHRHRDRNLTRHSNRNLDRHVDGNRYGHIDRDGLGNLHWVLNGNRNIDGNCHLNGHLAINLNLHGTVHLNLDWVIVWNRNPNIDCIRLGNLDGIRDVHGNVHRNVDRALNGVRVGNGHRNLASLHQDLRNNNTRSHGGSFQLCLLEHIPPTTDALALAEKERFTTIKRFRIAVVNPAGAQTRSHNSSEVEPISTNALSTVYVEGCTVVCGPGKSIDKLAWAERSEGGSTHGLNTRLKSGKLGGSKPIETSRGNVVQASNALARIKERTIAINRLGYTVDETAGTKSRGLTHLPVEELSPRLSKLAARNELGTGLSELPIVRLGTGLGTGLSELGTGLSELGTRLNELGTGLDELRAKCARGKGRELGTRLVTCLKLSQKRINLSLSEAS